MTGWGQEGPLAPRAGHDLTYLALTGALAAIGPADGDPVPPLNLVADYGGGSMLLLVGVLAALVERGVGGRGQVVDAAMVDGTTSLLALTYTLFGAGLWRLDRGVNLLDGGAPYYATYRCSDGGHVAVAALEERFWGELVRVLDLDLSGLGPRKDPRPGPNCVPGSPRRSPPAPGTTGRSCSPPLDACVAPVLTLAETLEHPQLGGRGTVTRSTVPGIAGSPEPGPAPRFSRTPASAGPPAPSRRRRHPRGDGRLGPARVRRPESARPRGRRPGRPTPRVIKASAGRHPDGAVEADRLAVEHRVGDDVLDQRGVLVGSPSRLGCGTCWPSDSRASSGSPAASACRTGPARS